MAVYKYQDILCYVRTVHEYEERKGYHNKIKVFREI